MNSCLLTITVLTYNSEKYISEALNSMLFQETKDVQLIISDDCSTDKTCEIIDSWIKNNQLNFFEVVFLKSNLNLGVTKNKIKTIPLIKGQWEKGLAGDDLFHENAIKNIKQDIFKYSDSKIIIGCVQIFGEKVNSKAILPRKNLIKKIQSKIDNQLIYLFEGYTYPAVSFLVHRSLILPKNFDLKYRNMEDVPFHFKQLISGNKFVFSESIYVRYRKHDTNLSNPQKGKVISEYQYQYYQVLKNYAIKHKSIKYFINSIWSMIFTKLIYILGNKGWWCKSLDFIRRKFQPKKAFNIFRSPFR